ncbi:MAG TPA: hypothetical protein VHB21_04765 [Minicystis sp.]|nr:hypothetical protein [Minicystis sp.]
MRTIVLSMRARVLFWRAVALLLGAALVLAVDTAHAAGTRIELRVSAPSACTDADRLRAAIDGIRGPGRSGAGAPFAADVEITGVQGEYHLAISVHAAGAPTRELVDPDCHHLADAAAVILALAIEDAEQRAREAKPPRRETAPAAAPRSPAQRSSPVAPRRFGPRASEPVHLALAAGTSLDLAALPAPALGFSAGLAVARRDLVGEAAFVAFAPRAAEVAGGHGGGEMSFIAGALRACWTPLRAAAVAWGPCAGVELGATRGVGFGVERPSADTEPWVAPDAGVRAELRVERRLALVAGGDALFPVIRPHFRLQGVGEVFQPPPVSGRFSLGLEIRLW